MHCIHSLPGGYRECLRIDLQKDRKAALLVNGAALLLTLLLLWLWVCFTIFCVGIAYRWTFICDAVEGFHPLQFYVLALPPCAVSPVPAALPPALPLPLQPADRTIREAHKITLIHFLPHILCLLIFRLHSLRIFERLIHRHPADLSVFKHRDYYI